MVPDILGWELDIGIEILKKHGFKGEDIIIREYTSPKKDTIGNDMRILKTDISCGKITLFVSYF